jgi:hypothetical protein
MSLLVICVLVLFRITSAILIRLLLARSFLSPNSSSHNKTDLLDLPKCIIECLRQIKGDIRIALALRASFIWRTAYECRFLRRFGIQGARVEEMPLLVTGGNT